MRDLEFVFGQLLKDRRIAMGLSPKQLAEKLGYRNIVKGIRRINEAEEGGGDNNKLQEIMAVGTKELTNISFLKQIQTARSRPKPLSCRPLRSNRN